MHFVVPMVKLQRESDTIPCPQFVAAPPSFCHINVTIPASFTDSVSVTFGDIPSKIHSRLYMLFYYKNLSECVRIAI